jgi:hypothetical protein
MEIPKMLTVDEASALLKIPKQTLALWRTWRRGPQYIKLGHAVRYTESDLLEYLKVQKIDPRKSPPR